jgi:hypothetical protein
VANNTFPLLWLNTSFGEKNIITPEALKYAPQGVHDILLLVKDNTSAIYVHEPLPLGKDHIQKLQHNLRQHHLSPSVLTSRGGSNTRRTDKKNRSRNLT